MKKTKNRSFVTLTGLAAFVAAPFMGWGSNRATAATVVGNLSVPVTAPLVVTDIQNLRFGSVISAADSTITVNTSGMRTATTGGILAGGTVSQGIIRISGNAGAVVTFSVVEDTITLSNATNSTIQVDNFVLSPLPAQTIDGDGQIDINVGADIHLLDSHKTGSYSGTYSFKVSFQ